MDRFFRLNMLLTFLLIIFLNAFVDLGHKILIQNIVFKVYNGESQVILTTILNGLILLPFVLLFTPAGYLADRLPKPRVMRYSAAVAILLTLVTTLAYYRGWFQVAFAMTFLLAVQSAFYSPAKYGYIKELSGQEGLVKANAQVQAVTIVAILLGIFIFSIFFEQRLNGAIFCHEAELLKRIAPIGWILVVCSVSEFLLTRRLVYRTQPEPATSFDWRHYAKGGYLRNNLRKLHSNRNIWLSIVGLSLFWGISQVLLAAFPAFAKASHGITNTVIIQGLLACSGIGIMAGSLLAGRLSRHHIETGLIPAGASGIVIALLTLPSLTSPLLLAADFIFLGLCGGLFIVPLNALIQFQSKDEELGTILAGNNWLQNVVMFGFLALTLLFSLTGTDSKQLLYLLGLIAFLGAIYTLYQLPHSLVRFLVGRLFSTRYRINIVGFEHLPGQGPVLMLGNHISWLDWAMIQIACPRPVRFVMHRTIYQRWYLQWLFDLFGVIPIAGGDSQSAIETINRLLKAGEVVCLFPEGAISRNGQLGTFKRGYERAIHNVDGVILPFYLRGLWGSRFSRSSKKMQLNRRGGLRRDIIVAFGSPLPMLTPADELKRHVFDLSISAWEAHTQHFEPLPLAWIRSAKRFANSPCIIEGATGVTLSGYRTLTATLAFARQIRRHSPQRHIGLLLPTGSGGLIANLAGLIGNKCVVNLNYTAPLASLQHAMEQAEISCLYTSKRFLHKLKQRGIYMEPLLNRLHVFYLEEMKDDISPVQGLFWSLSARLLPARWLYTLFGRPLDNNQPAAILFSSGSEGTPKGVILSHRNIMANIRQVSDVLDTRDDDRIMATLPLFHAFGLTVTGLMPLIETIPLISHPDPTDVLPIAKAITRYQATIYCATSTFLRLLTRNKRVHPLMLSPLRIVIAGAERLQHEVRHAFSMKFNKEIYEGYGTTETTPVASVNIPDRIDEQDWYIQTGQKIGSVGMPLPGGSFRIVDPHTFATLPTGEDGLILIGGSQLMVGYLNDPERSRDAIRELDGRRWYLSGDKGHLDEDGFLTIVDRYSRFAKIGGEMISLGAVEQQIARLFPEEEAVEMLATSVPDEQKGERILLLVAGEINPDRVQSRIKLSSINPLMRPAKILSVAQIPKLGSGKNDYSRARTLALQAEG